MLRKPPVQHRKMVAGGDISPCSPAYKHTQSNLSNKVCGRMPAHHVTLCIASSIVSASASDWNFGHKVTENITFTEISYLCCRNVRKLCTIRIMSKMYSTGIWHEMTLPFHSFRSYMVTATHLHWVWKYCWADRLDLFFGSWLIWKTAGYSGQAGVNVDSHIQQMDMAS